MPASLPVTRLAIFDFDGTILCGNSWHEFFRRELRRRPGRAPLLIGAWLFRRLRIWNGARLRGFALRGLRGRSFSEIQAVGAALHATRLAARIRRGAVEEIDRRRSAGFTIVIATGAWDFIVSPFAHSVRADVVIATPVVFEKNECLGAIDGEERLGPAKAAAITARFGAETGVDWNASCAYTDSSLDAPLLQLVGERWLVTTAPVAPPEFPPGTRVCRWSDPGD